MVVVPRCAPSWKRPDLCLQPLHTHSIRSSVDSFTSTSTLVVDQCGTPLRSSLTPPKLQSRDWHNVWATAIMTCSSPEGHPDSSHQLVQMSLTHNCLLALCSYEYSRSIFPMFYVLINDMAILIIQPDMMIYMMYQPYPDLQEQSGPMF